MTTPAQPTPDPTPTAPAAPAQAPPDPATPPADPPKPTDPDPAKEPDWKAEARKWEQRAKDNKAASDRLAEIEAASQTETEKATARADAAEKRAADLVSRTVRAEATALAADTFADPSDAHLYVDLSEFVDADGLADPDRLKTALADVLAKKPHLAKQPGRPTGDIGQGPRTDASPPIDQQIAEATAAGDHVRAIALKQQKAHAAQAAAKT